MLSKNTILTLQEIIRQEYDKKISFEEAEEIANTLVGYFDLLGRLYHEINDKDGNFDGSGCNTTTK